MRLLVQIQWAILNSALPSYKIINSCSFFFIFILKAYPVILGDIDNSGSLSAQIIHQFSQRIKGKCVVQV